MVLKKLISTLFKVYFSTFFFIIFNFTASFSYELKNCNNFNSLSHKNGSNYLPIKSIDIKINEYKKWQVNNIRILTNTSHLIPDRFKGKFNAKVKIKYDNNLVCNIEAKVRTHGDLKDHIYYKDGKVFQSLDVRLENGHINNITKFKLFLSKTRGVDEDEVFMTELLRQLNFISPRTQIVEVNVNGERNMMLFQEKSSKELLEFHKRREGPILEGDEKYMMMFSSKVKNYEGINWGEIFRVSELGSKIQLAKVTNSSWALRNDTFKKSAFRALDKLNFAYLVYLNNFNDDKNNFSFLDYHLDNKILSQGSKKNLNYLNIYDGLVLAANGNHGLYVHNRKFYWNSEENYFEPIYYDGEFNLKKTPKKLNFPLSENFTDSFDKLRVLLADLNLENFSNHLKSKKLFYNEKEIEAKIKLILNNLSTLEQLFVEKTIEQIKYNNESYLEKDLKKTYLENFKKQDIKTRFIEYDISENSFKLCSDDISVCNMDFNIDIQAQRELLESELEIDGDKYEYIKLKNDRKKLFDNNFFDDENLKKVIFYFNNGIEYKYDIKNNIFIIEQKDLTGRSFFIGGEINNLQIIYNGKLEYYQNKLAKRLDSKNLTGCLSFIKVKFNKSSLSSNNSTCEDGINIINSSGKIDNILSNNSLYDAIDMDFSKIIINNINIKNALNDCIDFSYGEYKILYSSLKYCGDKAVSVGEKSIANFNNINLQNAKIGVASKDSSNVMIDNSTISSVENCFASYKKKQEFDGGFIKVNKSNCKNFSKNHFLDKHSKIEISNQEDS
ncbi:hypothetical protein OA434_00115 [Candidatus Pelagibacter sp.]|nr:hypothetical protein [Candidatus Pelagibacter sp.]